MLIRYKALLRLMMLPVVRYSAATSGTADRTDVDEIGARKPHKDSTAVMISFLCSEKRSY
jgi:hypothetical protein